MQDFPVRSEAKDLGKQTREKRIGQRHAVSKYLKTNDTQCISPLHSNLGFNCYNLRAGLRKLETDCMVTITTINTCRKDVNTDSAQAC
jgi:hypothetical protein